MSGSELTRVLERTIRDSNVLDTESLCIVSGDKVWAIKCDVTVTDYGGNVIDASVLAMVRRWSQRCGFCCQQPAWH